MVIRENVCVSSKLNLLFFRRNTLCQLNSWRALPYLVLLLLLPCFWWLAEANCLIKLLILLWSGSKEITFYVEDQYKAFVESAAKAYEKEAGVKVTIKTGDQLGGLDNLSLDNQSRKSCWRYDGSYDRVGSLGTDGQLSEVTLSDGAKTDDNN